MDHTGEKCNSCGNGTLKKAPNQIFLLNSNQENISPMLGDYADKYYCGTCGLFHLYALRK